jgi:hypothetical protein
MEIDPSGSDSGLLTPPPLEQTTTGNRAVVVHPIPNREGNRKQDMGRDDDQVTLIGIALTADAGALLNMKNTSNSGGAYTVTYTPDAGPGISYPPLWLQRVSIGVRKGTSKWFTFSIVFIEKNQT